MSNIKVTLEPRYIQKATQNLVLDVHIDDWVVVENVDTGERRSWGYCPLDEGPYIRGTWLPLSGFPKELAPEVQRQINIIRGYTKENAPAPPNMIETGRTAGEQEADGIEEYEDEDDC